MSRGINPQLIKLDNTRGFPRINGRKLTSRVVAACERFDSLAETVWTANPASFYTNEQCDGPLTKRQSPLKGTQRLKEEQRPRGRDR